MSTKTLRAADLQLYINGRLFGPCLGLRWTADNGRHAISGIDSTTPFELAPGQTSIKGSVDCFRLRRDGGLEGQGIAAPESQIMLEKYISIAIIDRSTDSVILAIEEAAISQQTWQVRPKDSMVEGSFAFEGISWTGDTNT